MSLLLIMGLMWAFAFPWTQDSVTLWVGLRQDTTGKSLKFLRSLLEVVDPLTNRMS